MNNAHESTISTGEHHGYAVKFSNFKKNLLACACAEYYGLSGGGRLILFDYQSRSNIKIQNIFDYQDGLFCVTWSEINPNLVIAGTSAGGVVIFDYTTSTSPIAYYHTHSKEIYSVDWSPQNAYTTILTSSWDGTCKVANPFVEKEITTFEGHTDQVHEAQWCKSVPETFASVSADHTLMLWDVRVKGATGVYLHETEVLCLDWSKTDPDIIATGTNSGDIWEWDKRKMNVPLFVLSGHEFAVRRLKFSPFERGRLASVGYDFTTRFWNWNVRQPLQSNKKHTEFVYGLDYSILRQNTAVDCSWDSTIHVYHETTS